MRTSERALAALVLMCFIFSCGCGGGRAALHSPEQSVEPAEDPPTTAPDSGPPTAAVDPSTAPCSELEVDILFISDGSLPSPPPTKVTDEVNISWSDIGVARCLTEVGGDLIIRHATGLTTLAGLTALTKVEGSVRIERNPDLTSLDGLEGLERVGEDLIIDENDHLTSLAGLSSLRSLGGELHIISNNSLGSLAGLGSIRRVHELEIWGNSSLTTLAGLEALESISIQLYLHNTALTSLQGLTALRSVGGSLDGGVVITDNEHLTSLTGLDSLTFSQNGVLITRNPNLTSLAGLGSLGRVDSLAITHNPRLPTCAARALRRQIEAAGGRRDRVVIDDTDDRARCD